MRRHRGRSFGKCSRWILKLVVLKCDWTGAGRIIIRVVDPWIWRCRCELSTRRKSDGRRVKLVTARYGGELFPCDDFTARAMSPSGISPTPGDLEKTTPTQEVHIPSRHNVTDTITLQTGSRNIADMPAMLLFGLAEAGYAPSASAPPPSLMLKLSQMKPSSPYSAAAQQPAVHLQAEVLLARQAAPLRRAWPGKLALIARHSRAR